MKCLLEKTTLFFHSFNKNLLSALLYYMPVNILSSRYTVMSKTDKKKSHGASILMREINNEEDKIHSFKIVVNTKEIRKRNGNKKLVGKMFYFR